MSSPAPPLRLLVSALPMMMSAPLLPVTVDPGSRNGFAQLLAGEAPRPLSDPALPTGWTNFYRSDDVSAVAYFYLDRPENGLPAISPFAQRGAALRGPAPPKP